MSVLKPLPFPQKSSVWYETHGAGNRSRVTTAGAAVPGAEQGGVRHFCAPAEAPPRPSLPFAGSPQEGSQFQRSAPQC